MFYTFCVRAQTCPAPVTDGKELVCLGAGNIILTVVESGVNSYGRNIDVGAFVGGKTRAHILTYLL